MLSTLRQDSSIIPSVHPPTLDPQTLHEPYRGQGRSFCFGTLFFCLPPSVYLTFPFYVLPPFLSRFFFFSTYPLSSSLNHSPFPSQSMYLNCNGQKMICFSNSHIHLLSSISFSFLHLFLSSLSSSLPPSFPNPPPFFSLALFVFPHSVTLFLLFFYLSLHLILIFPFSSLLIFLLIHSL